jgi:hypothetical protein
VFAEYQQDCRAGIYGLGEFEVDPAGTIRFRRIRMPDPLVETIRKKAVNDARHVVDHALDDWSAGLPIGAPDAQVALPTEPTAPTPGVHSPASRQRGRSKDAAPAIPSPTPVSAAPVPLANTVGLSTPVDDLRLGDPNLAAGLRLLGAAVRSHQPESVPSATPAPARRFMKEKEYEDYRRVGKTTLHKWRKLGLPTNGIQGRGIRIKVPEADAWLDAGGPELAIRESAERQAKKGDR